MKAMLLEKITDVRENPSPLRLGELPVPEPGVGQVRLVCADLRGLPYRA